MNVFNEGVDIPSVNLVRGLGRPPELEDFLYSDAAPSLEYFIRKYKSWVETKAKMQDLSSLDEQILHSGIHLELVQRLEQMLPAKWPYELVILSVAFQHGHATTEQVLTELGRRFHVADSLDHHQAIIQRAMDSLATPHAKQKWAFGGRAKDTFTVDAELLAAWHQPWCEGYLQERLEYGIVQFRRQYRPELFFSAPNGVIVYQNYTRSELKFLFQDPAAGSWREGVSHVGDHYETRIGPYAGPPQSYSLLGT